MIVVLCDHTLVARGLATALAVLATDVRRLPWDASEDVFDVDSQPAALVAHVEPQLPHSQWLPLVGRAPIVAIVRAADFESGLLLLRSGVTAILSEECTDEQLLGALSHAASGVVTICPGLLDGTLSLLQKHELARYRATQRVSHLSTRERELLGLLGLGLSNLQIARRRCRAQSTIKAQVRDLMQRLGGSTRLEAALLSASAGLADSDSGRCSRPTHGHPRTTDVNEITPAAVFPPGGVRVTMTPRGSTGLLQSPSHIGRDS